MDYHVADIKDLIQGRMNIIGSKLVKNNKVIAENKESGNTEKFEIQRSMKVFGRQIEQRIDGVNDDHKRLTGKYDYLVTCNDYFAKIADQMITITELNSCLLTSDEKDRNSISLMGGKFPRNLQEQNHEHHLHRLQ